MATRRQNRQNRPLGVESLESLMLLSGMSDLSELRGLAVESAAARPVVLNGKTTGTFLETQSNPDTGKHFHVVTHGTTSQGATAVSGDLNTPGFIRGRTSGTLTVVTPKGTLTLDVRGPIQSGPAGLPARLGYRITGGTGAYAGHHSGSGTIDVTDNVTSTTTGQSLSAFSQSGTISLTFKAGSAKV